MRKLKLQVQVTLDGFMAGPNGEMDWMALPWTTDINQYVADLTAPVSTILLGRKLAEGFIPYWASVAADANNPEQAAGAKFTDTAKFVFTQSLKETEWPNTTLATGELAAEIARLKGAAGGDIIAYGGASFVNSLVRAGLVDEYHLFVNPTAIGAGLPVFPNGLRADLQLVRATSFDCGVVAMHLAPKAR